MQVTETKSEGLSRELKIALPAAEIEEKISHRLKELAQTAKLPGFRPGKVPVSVLRKKYGSSVMGEVLERAVNDSSQQALAEKGLRPAMQPEIEITEFEDGKDLEYTIAVEVLPEIRSIFPPSSSNAWFQTPIRAKSTAFWRRWRKPTAIPNRLRMTEKARMATF